MAHLTEKQERQVQYLAKILAAIQEGCFDEDAPNKIEIKDFNDSQRLTDFMHVIANGVPSRIYGQLTGQEVSHLEFNHIANQLVFQNSHLEE